MQIDYTRKYFESEYLNINASKKLTRDELRMLSRELLTYIPESKDVETANRIIHERLTPMNKVVAIEFLAHFLPWRVETKMERGKEVFLRFSKMERGKKRLARKELMIKEFLKNEDNNLWTWALENGLIKGIQRANLEKEKGRALSRLKHWFSSDKEVLKTMTGDERKEVIQYLTRIKKFLEVDGWRD